MKLSKNFDSSEFACKDGSATPPEVLENLKVVAKNLQVLRDFFGVAITINSGYRSPAHNKSLPGAAKNSQHLLGTAADIVVEGKRHVQVKAAIEKLIGEGKMHNGGLSQYNTFVHYDVRPKPARW